MMCSTPGRSRRDPESLKIYKLIFAGLLTLSLLSHAAIVWNEKGKIASGYGDFIIFYTGAQIVNAGRGKELYDLSLQAKLQEQFKVEIRKGPLPFNHLPYELVLFYRLPRCRSRPHTRSGRWSMGYYLSGFSSCCFHSSIPRTRSSWACC